MAQRSNNDEGLDIGTARDGVGARSLSRERVLDAAIEIIDRQGLRRLTMRRVGSALGVEAMALYRHVSDRDDLLDGIVDRIVDAMDDDAEVLTTPGIGWQDFLERLAHGIRHVALTHPSVFPLLVSQPPQAPWLRPPIRSLRWVEIFLDGLLAEGFDDHEAVDAYRAFTSFLLGYLLLEAAIHADTAAPHHHPSSPENLAAYPNLNRLQRELAKDKAEAEFAEGLENIIERISRLRQ